MWNLFLLLYPWLLFHNPPRAVHLFAMKIRDFKQAKNLPFRIFLSLFDAIFTLNLHHFFTLKLLSLSLSLSLCLRGLRFWNLRFYGKRHQLCKKSKLFLIDDISISIVKRLGTSYQVYRSEEYNMVALQYRGIMLSSHYCCRRDDFQGCYCLWITNHHLEGLAKGSLGIRSHNWAYMCFVNPENLKRRKNVQWLLGLRSNTVILCEHSGDDEDEAEEMCGGREYSGTPETFGTKFQPRRIGE